MHYTVTAASFLLILMLAFPLPAQYPGRYPGGIGSPYPGRYPTGPGIPIPRRSKDKKADNKSQQPQLQSLTGVLRQMDDASVTIVAQDTRTITAKRSDTMKVFKKGEEISPGSLAKGDRVRIDATQDEQGFYHAVAIYVESEATPQDKAAAEAGAAPSRQKSDDSDDRPILRRQPAATDPGAETEKADSSPEPERPVRKVEIAEGNPNDLDPDRPHQRRGKPPARKSPARPDSAADNPTAQTRSETRSTAPPEPQVVASNRPNVQADRTEAPGPREDVRIA